MNELLIIVCKTAALALTWRWHVLLGMSTPVMNVIGHP